MTIKKDNVKSKENFCPACVAIPLTMVGAGISTSSSKINKNYRKIKNMICVFSFLITFLFFFIGVYFLFIKKDCNKCIS
jgi:hypothetical protein